jgi:hypothetical protein
MPLVNQLRLSRCPHCQIANPNLSLVASFVTTNSENRNPKDWACYACRTVEE